MHSDEREDHDGFDHEVHDHDVHGHAPALDLGVDERLPWLESADDDDAEDQGSGRGRLFGLGAVALMILALLVGGVYWITHRGGSTRPADGSLIEASKDPYKVAPSDPGGKTFAGTGDESFKVSQGEHPDASLAGSAGTTPPPAGSASGSTAATPPTAAASAKPAPAAAATPAAKPAAHEAAVATGPAAPAGGAVAVQVGAYSTNALAETAWSHLTAGHDILKGLGHRVVEGKADIGTVYRLQALAADGAAANSLCSRLQADGVKCQVKH
eukprot:gene18592-18879_t